MTNQAVLTGQRRPIAICGIGCRYPGGADTPELFWEILKNKVDAITSVPKQRWDKDAFYHPDYRAQGRIHINEGGFISDVDTFDASFFGVSPNEARAMDPAHRLLLEHTFLAVEDAGMDINALAGSRTGVYVGTSASEYAGIMQGYTERARINQHTNTGSSPAIAANRISYVFDLHGPSFSVDTACSASMVAAHLACRAIWNNEASGAIVAGVNLMLKPELHMGFSTAGFLSPDARSKSFDAAANGYVRSEGVGVLFLRPLDEALHDGNQIYAVVLGSAINEDGKTDGIALPNPDAQVEVMEAAYRDAGIAPQLVTCVEAHGTGTAAGDPIECSSIGQVIGAHRADTCYIGSVKSNIGHTELASGVAGLIKLALQLKHREICPTVHYQTANPKIDFDKLHLKVATKPLPLPEKNGVVYGAVNSFGFGGANAHLILSSYTSEQPAATLATPIDAIPFLISGRDAASLRRVARTYGTFLGESDSALDALAHKAAFNRSHLEMRGTVIASDMEQLREGLAAIQNEAVNDAVVSGRPVVADPVPVAFVFSGQGAQWFAMGRELLTTNAVFKRTVQEVNDILKTLGWLAGDNSDLLCELQKNQDDSRINETHIVQPALFALQVGLARLWMAMGVTPTAVVGHSIGEVAASYISGALNLEDACKVVYWRSRCQQKASGRGRMLAVGLDETAALETLSRFSGLVEIAAVNGPQMTVMAGDSEALEMVANLLEMDDVFFRFLVVDVPFHCHLLEDVTEEFRASMPDLQPGKTTIPLYSTVHGRLVQGSEITVDYWARNIRQTVLFYPTIVQMVKDGLSAFVEVSPHPILGHGIGAALKAEQRDGIVVGSLKRKTPENAQLARFLAELHVGGLSIDWARFFGSAQYNTTPLPCFPFYKERYWLESDSARTARLGTRIHPHLVDLQRPADTSRDAIWQVELYPEQHPYIGDHRVQGPIVYPGAGHVDLIASAARASFNARFQYVADIEFMNPLFIPEVGDTLEVQIHFHTDEGRFVIASRGHGGDWQVHSRGQLGFSEDAFMAPTESLDKLRARIAEPVEMAPLYDMLHRGGLVLGETFKGIASLHRGHGESLAKVVVHPSLKNIISRYTMHPTLLDASFQSAFGIIENRATMGVYIPRFIHRIKPVSPIVGDHIYAHATAAGVDANRLLVDITLYNPDGTVVAFVQRFEGAYLKGSRGERVGDRDAMFHRWQTRPALRVADMQNKDSATVLNRYVDADVKAAIQHMGSPALETLFHGSYAAFTADLCEYYAVQLIREMNGELKSGASVDSTALARQTTGLPHHEKLLGYVFDFLTERGVLQPGAPSMFTVQRVPEAKMPQCKDQDAINAAFATELQLIHAAGPHLKAVLTGEKDPSEVLFSSPQRGLLFDYYATAYTTAKYNTLTAAALSAMVGNAGTKPLRILEIGAGTGGLTQALLPVLAGVKRDHLHYSFTDVSSYFFEQAAGRFGAYGFVEYGVLDIERCPVEQGYIAHSFDIVIASNAVHATKDLNDSLHYVQKLLARNGQLLLLEVTSPPVYLDFVFGMTDGWWRFDDEYRTDRCAIASEQWRTVLSKNGFVDVHLYSDVEDPEHMAQTLFVARNEIVDVTNFSDAVVVEKAPRFIVVSDDATVYRGFAKIWPDAVQLKKGQQTAVVNDSLITWDDDASSLVSILARPVFAASPLCVIFATPLQLPRDAFDLPYQDVLVATMTRATSLCNALGTNETAQFVAITQGVYQATSHLGAAPIWGLWRVMMNEYPQLDVRIIDIDALNDTNLGAIAAEVAAAPMAPTTEEVVFVNGQRHVNRLERVLPSTRETEALDQLSQSKGDFFLAASPQDRVDESRFVSVMLPDVGRDDVEIAVDTAGLNFRDVMVAAGMLPDKAIRGGLFSDRLGLECAGTVTAVGTGVTHVQPGDFVLALARQSIANKCVAPAACVKPLPPSMSRDKAGAYPMALLTAWYAIHDLARLQKGESILIHSAAGGVGLMAVQIARQKGAVVYATASRKKHALLHQYHVEAVFDSRSYNYASDLLNHTGGKKVDVIINSLADVHVTKSLQLLAPGGRFVELGKFDLYNNKTVGLELLANNISYFALDIDRLLVQVPERMSSVLDSALAFYDAHCLNMPVQVFEYARAADALTQMAQGEHTGKLILKNSPVPIYAARELQLPSNATYLIAGGTRGLGLAVGEFLAARGARRLVLASRSGLTGDVERQTVASLRADGVEVLVHQVDITDCAAVTALITKSQRVDAPLRGIFQSTLVLADAMLDKMTPAQMAKPLAPKIIGTWNLHKATKDLDLDYFVSFSSISSMYGFPGQANYAAANRFLDDFAGYRRRLGLAASTVNWGALDEVGYVSREQGVQKFLTANGWFPTGKTDTLWALERVMLESMTNVAFFNADWKRIGETFPQSIGSMRFGHLHRNESQGAQPGEDADFMQVLTDAPAGKRPALALKMLAEVVERILGTNRKSLDFDTPINRMGLDSLVANQLRSIITDQTGVEFSLMQIMQGPTLNQLAEDIGARFVGAGDTGPGSKWILQGSNDDQATARLFTLPYLGAGASIYSEWDLGDAISLCPIQLPGREERSLEPSVTDAHDLMEQMATAMEPLLDKPFAIYGHSFGGNIALSLASYLQHKRQKVADAVFIAAAVPPDVDNPLEQQFKLADGAAALAMDDADLKALMKQIGTPAAVLDNEDTFEKIKPALKADLAITKQRTVPLGQTISSSIVGLHAVGDHLYDADMVSEWAAYSDRFELITIEGPHLFVHEAPAVRQVADIIKRTIPRLSIQGV